MATITKKETWGKCYGEVIYTYTVAQNPTGTVVNVTQCKITGYTSSDATVTERAHVAMWKASSFKFIVDEIQIASAQGDGTHTVSGKAIFSKTISSQSKTIGIKQNDGTSYISSTTITVPALDCPPTFDVVATYDDPLYANHSQYQVIISNARGQYGFTISNIILTVGEKSSSRTDDGRLSVDIQSSGNIVPQVKAIDSAGQITTQTLDPILVYKDYVPITLLGSRALNKVENNTYETINGIRIDMLVDCRLSGDIINILPSSMKALYHMDSTQIVLPYTPPKGFIQCYGILDANNPSPQSNLWLSLVNPVGGRQYYVGYPSTATPTQIKQQGETDPISPRIDVTNVRFNPETTNLPYNVGDIVGINTTTMTKSQTNVDGDIKHIVTHADNVMIDANTTLQDWITEQYSYLT